MKGYRELSIDHMIRKNKKQGFYARNEYYILAGLQGLFIGVFILTLLGGFA